MLKSIIAVTIMVFNLSTTEDAYRDYLGYQVVERGVISEQLATVWGTPAAIGRNYAIMQPESGAEVYLRFIEGPEVEGYKAMTTHGWNATELLVQDVYAMGEKLKESPFEIIGVPRPLSEGSIIHAMQVLGPSGEVVYLTEVGEANADRLGHANSYVDRTFIVIVAGAEMSEMVAFYGDKLNHPVQQWGAFPITVVANAMGLTPGETTFPLAVAALPSPFQIELDDYPDSADDRPVAPHDLPPGMNMVSFAVDSIEGTGLELIAAPQTIDTAPYAGRRVALSRGISGELIELIETPASK